MPFNELQRRESWPPTVVRLRDNELEESEAIDANPISFFLTPSDLSDFSDDDEDLSAGIESSSRKTLPIREISPSSIQKRSPPPPTIIEEDEEEDIEIGMAMPLTLKEFTRKYSSDGRQSRSSQRTEDGLTGLGIAIPEGAARRGRATVRLTPSRNGKSTGRGQRQTRSLSARRPRSWRAPSPDLVPILEERESDEDEHEKENITEDRKQEISISAPPNAYVEQVVKPVVEKKKKKKRVHWAF